MAVETESDEQAIRETILGLSDGIGRLDAGKIKEAFHWNARVMTQTATEMCDHDADKWDRIISDARSDPGHVFRQGEARKRIAFIDVTGNAASAKVEWIFGDLMYTDYYTMLKIDGRWYIMNQVYQETSLK
jgi:hypothetical protein